MDQCAKSFSNSIEPVFPIDHYDSISKLCGIDIMNSFHLSANFLKVGVFSKFS